MKIYIDESGVFANPQRRDHCVSCVAAVAVPGSRGDRFCDGLLGLKCEWGRGRSEAKGRTLDEAQVSAVLHLLADCDAIAEVSALDSGLTSDATVTRHKMRQAEGAIANITPEHTQEAVAGLHDWARRIRGLSNPLYAQAQLTFVAIEKLLHSALLYYGQRRPEELGEFSWFVDANDRDVNE